MTKLESFEWYKSEMADKLQKEIASSSELRKNSTIFYQNHLREYATNNLFLELLDFQIYLTEKNIDFKQYFQKKNGKECDNDNFPFIFPFYEETPVNIQYQDFSQISGEEFMKRRNRNTQSTFNKQTFIYSINSLINNDLTKQKLLSFLIEHQEFDYYFWNVTFPNMFLGFISTEYCEKAIIFLKGFKSNINIFTKGISSFINHNYFFRDSFLKSFFISGQKDYDKKTSQEKIIELTLQESLQRAVQKLTVQQLDFLDELITDHPKEARRMFFDEIIINNIKLWKYSPLYSPFQIGKKKDQFDVDYVIDYLQTEFCNDENLTQFLNPVFNSIHSRITINEVNIKRIVNNNPHNLIATFLDILIIVKVSGNQELNNHFSSLMGKFNNRYLLKKAFSYMFYDQNYSCPKDIDVVVKRPTFDIKVFQKWLQTKKDYTQRNKNILSCFYDDKELDELKKIDPELPLVGIASMYYDFEEYEKTKEILKQESRVLITLKAIIESQESIIEVYTNHFSTIRPLKDDSFTENLKTLFKLTMKNILTKCINSSYKLTNPYTVQISNSNKEIIILENQKDLKDKDKQKRIQTERKSIQKLQEARQKDVIEIKEYMNKTIDDAFSNDFDTYFKREDGAEELFLFYCKLSKTLYDDFLQRKGSSTQNDNYKYSYSNYTRYMKYLTRAYLINHYNKIDIKVVTIDCKPPEFEVNEDNLQPYAVSGVFKYINDLVDLLKGPNYITDQIIQIGQICAALPVINKFITQLVCSDYLQSILVNNGIDSEQELAICILGYAFKFYSNPDQNTKIIDFLQFLFTASKELKSLGSPLPYFRELIEEFDFWDSVSKYISDQNEPSKQ